MALKPTIYKFKIDISNLDDDIYESLELTVAQHPSESIQRMLVRVLAYCLNVHSELSFTRGLSAIDEPDLWQKTLDDRIVKWIEVGEPETDRVKKASRRAEQVYIYSFNSKSDVWWSQNKRKLLDLNARVFKFDSGDVERFSALLSRTMNFSLTVSESTLFVSSELGDSELVCHSLNEQPA